MARKCVQAPDFAARNYVKSHLVSLGYFWFLNKHPIILLGVFFGLLFALLFESKGGLAPVSEIWEKAKTSAASPAATTGGGNAI